jgi:hypothetical protein
VCGDCCTGVVVLGRRRVAGGTGRAEGEDVMRGMGEGQRVELVESAVFTSSYRDSSVRFF